MENKIGIIEVIKRELGRIVSRYIYLFAAVVIPLFSYVFFTTMFSAGLPTRLPLGVIDNDNSTLSRTLIRQIDALQNSHVKMHLINFDEGVHEMRKGEIYAFIEIPRDFESDVLGNRQPVLNIYNNNVYYIPGSLLFKDLSTIAALSSASVSLSTALAKGVDTETIMGQLQPVNVDPHLIGNPYTNYSVYLSNVLMPGILQLMILLITVFAIGTELKDRTSREWLRTGEGSIMIALTGKLFPYTAIFTILVVFQNVILFRILGFPLHNSIMNMLLASVLFVLATQAFGIFLIGTVPVMRSALSFASVIGVLGISYSGFTFPVEQMPVAVQAIAQLFPMHHFYKIYQNSALNGAPLDYYWSSFLALLMFLILPFIVMIRLKKALIYQNFPRK